MTIPEELKKELFAISYELELLATDPVLFEKIVQTLEKQEFNNEQIQAIQDAATPTLFQKVDGGNFVHSLAKGFTDSVAKTSAMISYGINYDMDNLLIKALDNGKKCLKDIVHNYTMLFGDNTTPVIEDALEKYEQKISELATAFETINAMQDVPYTPNPDKNHYDGRDHLKRLPENFETLGIETPEQSNVPTCS